MTITTTREINSRQDFLEDCSTYCDTFRTQLGEEKLLITYVRRGKRPTPNFFIEGTDGTVRVARQGRKRPQGVIVAFKDDDGKIMIGWSLCRKTEPFIKVVGLRYAIERAIPLEELKELPICIKALETRLTSTPLLPDVTKEQTEQELEELLAKQPPHSVRATLSRFIERIENGQKET